MNLWNETVIAPARLAFTQKDDDAIQNFIGNGWGSALIACAPPSTLNFSASHALTIINLNQTFAYARTNASDSAEVYAQAWHSFPQIVTPSCRNVTTFREVEGYFDGLQQLNTTTPVFISIVSNFSTTPLLQAADFTKDCKKTLDLGLKIISHAYSSLSPIDGLGSQNLKSLAGGYLNPLATPVQPVEPEIIDWLRESLPPHTNQYLDTTLEVALRQSLSADDIVNGIQTCVHGKHGCTTLGYTGFAALGGVGQLFVFGFIALFITLLWILNARYLWLRRKYCKQAQPTGQLRCFPVEILRFENALLDTSFALWDAVLVLTLIGCIELELYTDPSHAFYEQALLPCMFTFMMFATCTLIPLHVYRARLYMRLARICLQMVIFGFGTYLGYSKLFDYSFSFGLSEWKPIPIDVLCWGEKFGETPWIVIEANRMVKGVSVVCLVMFLVAYFFITLPLLLIVVPLLPIFGVVGMWVSFGMVQRNRKQGGHIYGPSFQDRDWSVGQLNATGFFIAPILYFLFAFAVIVVKDLKRSSAEGQHTHDDRNDPYIAALSELVTGSSDVPSTATAEEQLEGEIPGSNTHELEQRSPIITSPLTHNGVAY